MKYVCAAIALLVSAIFPGAAWAQISQALTVSVWFSPATLSAGSPRLVANSHTDVDFKGFQLMVNSGGASGFFDVGNGTAEGRATWSQQLAVGTWYHYVGVYDGATVKAYINGVQVASTAFAGGAIAAGTGPDINVGRNPAYTSDYFNGSIYDVRVYATALSANQILALFNAVTPPPPPPPPTGVACAIGPPAPSIPGPAQAAGFTTCAANYDWRSTSNFTSNGHTYNFSQINTWLDCAGAANPLWALTGGIANCGDVTVAYDSQAGSNALLLTVQPSDPAGNPLVIATGIEGAPGDTCLLPVGTANGCITIFPIMNMYVEFAFAVTSDVLARPNGNFGALDIWAWWTRRDNTTPYDTYTGGTEKDWLEVATNGSGTSAPAGTALHQWDASCPNSPCSFTLSSTGSSFPGLDTNYHTSAVLNTSDGAHVSASCVYADGVGKDSCASWDPAAPNGGSGNGADATQTSFLINWNYSNQTAQVTVPTTVKMLYERVWSCPTWQNSPTANCLASQVFRGTPP